ncbi:phosphatase PAP2 family protein, partial [bacterium]|nr:phosphatase PAP2 family protein [bacterium]
IITLIFILGSISAQDRYESFPAWVKSVPEYGFNRMKNTVTRKSNLLILGTVSIGAVLAYQFDNQFQDYALREGLLPDRVSQFGDLYGGIWSAWLLPVSIIITSKASDESNNEMLGKLEFAASALVVNGVTTVILKELIGRERPNGSNNRSMPSGHTSHSFAVAAVANELYGRKVGTAAYLIAGLVAVSRINDNDHYLSDVIVGAGLGAVIGRGFAKTYQEKKHIPNLTINNKGLNIMYDF